MINVSDCDKEPIHIPGMIQPHGMLFVISQDSFAIEQISQNVKDYWAIDPNDLLSKNFFDLFQEKLTDKQIKHAFFEERGTVCLTPLSGRKVEIIAHQFDDCLIVEVEEVESERIDIREVFNGLGTAATQMQKTKDLVELCQMATDEVQRLTGYDRVMLYRFDKDWNGNVIAETLSSEEVDSYMNHWFPASDIPAQARAMLAINWLRSIPDVNFSPSLIYPTINPRTKRPLNLGKSIFRSPSPIHLEYLRNMNVGGTLTISLMQEDKLWGLIACHHETAIPIKHDQRIACQFIGQIISTMISSREVFEDFEYSKKIEKVFDEIFSHMSKTEDYVDGLVSHQPNLLDLTSSDGAAAAIYAEGEWTVLGNTPSIEEIEALVTWISQVNPSQDVFVTDSLPILYPPAEKYKELASGVMAISIPKGKKNFVLWFRPEVIQTVTWAGDPQKTVELREGTLTLHPRKSFDAWQLELRLKSKQWKDCEVEAAKKIRRAIIEFDLGRQFRRFQDLANSVDQFIWTANSEGKADYFNKRWFEITGLSENIKSDVLRQIVVHPDDLLHVNQTWSHAIENGIPYQIEFRLKDKFGNYRWFLSKAVPVKDADGRVTKWYGAGTDIQSSKEVEVALKEAISTRDEFISVASHELKTPITSIKLMLQLIQRSINPSADGFVPTEKLVRNLDRSSKELRKLETLIDDLLNVTKIKTGHLNYQFEKTNVTTLVKEVLDRYDGDSRVLESLQTIAKTPEYEIPCDRFRIEQVITNLVSNALKYGNNNPIYVSLEKRNKFIVIKVRDEGIGIAPEHHELVFNRFERAVQHKGISGLGLGLYICKTIVEAHHGNIKIESELGKGTTFILELPFS